MGAQMKKLRFAIIILGAVIVNISWLYANDINDVDFYAQREVYENSLKDYSFAYCVNAYVQDTVLSVDAGYASGGYFQNGWHTEPAYSDVRQFINDKIFKQSSVLYKSPKSQSVWLLNYISFKRISGFYY